MDLRTSAALFAIAVTMFFVVKFDKRTWAGVSRVGARGAPRLTLETPN